MGRQFIESMADNGRNFGLGDCLVEGLEDGFSGCESMRREQFDVQNLIIGPGNGRLEALERMVVSTDLASASERIGVYRRSYFGRLRECMVVQFPVVCYTLGVRLFGMFVVDYLVASPSTSYTLSDLGSGFVQFLTETRPKDGEDWIEFLIELASFEWSLNTLTSGLVSGGESCSGDLPGFGCVAVLMNCRFPTYKYYTNVHNLGSSCGVESVVSPAIPRPRKNLCVLFYADCSLKYLRLTQKQYSYLLCIKKCRYDQLPNVHHSTIEKWRAYGLLR